MRLPWKGAGIGEASKIGPGDQGVPLVQFTLGVMYAIGKGTP
jgi:hypothetical protein